MAPNPRVINAFRAMKDIGIPEVKTKAVLKHLLKVYEKNWELIEQENYRVLADAIFDSDESEVAEQKKKLDDAEAAEKKKLEQDERMKAIEDETQVQEEPVLPLKRMRVRHRDDQASSSISPNINAGGSLLKKPKLEVNELPGSQPEPQSPVEITETGSILRTNPQPLSPAKEGMNNAKQADLPIMLVKSKDEPLTDAPLRVGVRCAHAMPDLGPDYSGEPNTDAMSPAENMFEEENHFIPDETVDIAKGQENVIKKDDILPTDTLETGIVFEKETENGPEENNHIIPDKTVDLAKEQESVINTDAILPTDTLNSGNDFEKETENCLEENNHFIPPDETVNIAKVKEVVTNTYGISPTDLLGSRDDFEKENENGRGESYHIIPDEIVGIAKGQESMVNTDAISPMDTLKTMNVFEKETENAREENNHFIPDETIDIIKGQESVVNTENGFEEKNHFIPDEAIDIAKGEENVIISWVNEVNSECPPSFHYIPRNAVFQDAYVNFSLARITKENCCSTCFGNCLTSSTPCPCALQNGDKFAYSNEGTIKEDLLDDCIQSNRDPRKYHLSYCKECPLEKPKNEGVLGNCKGHLERSFIKECWLKCGCNKKCGNRVMQRGIRYKLQVFMTPGGNGWGLRALEDLPKGAFVCEYVGEVLTSKELYYRVSQSSKNDEHTYPVFLDAEWGDEGELQEDEALCLDATSYGNVARFINHRCFDANLIDIPVEVENPDRHYYHLAFFTTRKVKALEELTRDYGINFDDNDDPIKAAFECQCGSRFCRNSKGSSGSRKRKCAQN